MSTQPTNDELDQIRPIGSFGLTLSGRQLGHLAILLDHLTKLNTDLQNKYPEDHPEHIFNRGAAEAMLSFKELITGYWWEGTPQPQN